jgi:GTPase
MLVAEVVKWQTSLEVGRAQDLLLQSLQVKRDRVRKGMVMVHESLKPAASWEFDAEIAVLTHSTTIQPRYQSVIHCEIVRQAARVVAMDKERLRSGERATVRFRFLQRPEYITENTRFVFREGKTKGIGMVIGTEAQEKKDAAADAAGGLCAS